jgi:hypothetical protein
MDEIKIEEVLEFCERVLCNVPMLWKECSFKQQQRLHEFSAPRAFHTSRKQVIEHKQPVYFSAC